MSNRISIEQALQAYRVYNAPSNLSWKVHYANETFSSPDLLTCSEDERKQFAVRLRECLVTIGANRNSTTGRVATLEDVVDILTNPETKKIKKIDRRIVWGSSTGQRPSGDIAYKIWNGLQIIDLDIKSEERARKLKSVIFKALYKCNWFMGVTLSSSGMGLHVYTKIAIPENVSIPAVKGYETDNVSDDYKHRLLYMTNFRHKYSFVYMACLSALDEIGATKDELIKWIDISMGKPAQGAFLGYDPHPYINTHFFEDFIYVDFDTDTEIDWITHPDLKHVFKDKNFIDNTLDKCLDIKAEAMPLMDMNCKRIHYKYNDRWRLANTLVALYGGPQGYKYLRQICTLDIKDMELRGYCSTANKEKKPIDPWAVQKLRDNHGFDIKMTIDNKNFDESEIFSSMDRIDNPTIIYQSKHVKTFNLKANEYLGNIRNEILDACGLVTLIEAGAGVGKTEMVKTLVRSGKRVLMVMPFTSTIKAKVENDPDWYYCYGNRKVKLDQEANGLCVTIDKFAKLSEIGGLAAVKIANFDYIFIDESHLLFQSEYRPVMPTVIDMIKNTEVPVILMSGTPSGELTFFSSAIHLKVIKEETRKKVFSVNLVNTPTDVLYHMCRAMANDIAAGKRILFPCNRGTLYSKQVKAAVTYFLRYEHAMYDEVNLQYYKKSNVGDKFMDDINIDKTVSDVQILMCTTYLSVGVDILDRYNFSIYFEDLMMPQEVEQFANRLRSNDLFINTYIAKNDADGNPRFLHKYKEVDFALDNEEKKFVLSIIQLCNSMIKRNNQEYKSNNVVQNILGDCTFIKFNKVDNEYQLDLTAYKTVSFERKYREYVQQLPVLMKGMQAYGYEITSVDKNSFECTGIEDFANLEDFVRLAYDEQLQFNTTHIEELMEKITEATLPIYKDVLAGKYDIRKGNKWYYDQQAFKMTVKNVEIFEKVIPFFVSLSKTYDVERIKEIFEACRNKNNTFNFSAIGRVRTLVNLMYNDKNDRLDLPIKEFMTEAYKFADLGLVKKGAVEDFCNRFAEEYARKESHGQLNINMSFITMEKLKEKFQKLFKCLVTVGRPSKKTNMMVPLERIELLWKEREYYNSEDLNDKVFILADILDIPV